MNSTSRLALVVVPVVAVVGLAVPAQAAPPPGRILCQHQPTTLGGSGTGNPDRLKGDGNVDKRDIMHGLAGNDTLLGRSGDDILCGGPGDDRINGGRGYDVCISGGGRDRFTGCEELH